MTKIDFYCLYCSNKIDATELDFSSEFHKRCLDKLNKKEGLITHLYFVPNDYNDIFEDVRSLYVKEKDIIEKSFIIRLCLNLIFVRIINIGYEIPIIPTLENVEELDIWINNDFLEKYNLDQFINVKNLHVANYQNSSNIDLHDIKKLTKLDHIRINLPLLDMLPDIFNDLNTLKTIKIEESKITELPKSLYKLPFLKIIIIKSDSELIFDPLLKKLHSLKFLDVAENQHELELDILTNNLPDNLKRFDIHLHRFDHLDRKSLKYPEGIYLKFIKKLTKYFIVTDDTNIMSMNQGNNFVYCSSSFPDWIYDANKLLYIIILNKEGQQIILPDKIKNIHSLEKIYANNMHTIIYDEKITSFVKKNLYGMKNIKAWARENSIYLGNLT